MTKKEENKKEIRNKSESITEDLLKAKTENGFDIDSIMDVVESESDNNHKPINSLETIKAKLSEKKKTTDVDGKEIFQPIYSEEQKVKAMFGLLSERSINLLDFIERELEDTGYDGKIVFALNETMDRVSNTLRDISEIQYRKAKLENEKVHLEIQKYKADLKKKELDIKEKKYDKDKPSTTNVIAVGSQAELMKLITDGKGIPDANVVEE